MFDLGLPDRIRAKGVPVVLVPGWETRGSSSFAPFGAIDHDTVGAATGTIPSLNVLIYGRSDVPGPLAQVGQSREAGVGNDKAYVIAAGRANHGGTGAWRGLSGNSRFHGLEVEHTGYFTMPAHRVETAARITAAMLEAPGAARDAWWSCQHLEYATPKGRKIDISTGFETLAAREVFRRRVAYWIGRTIHTPPIEEDDMRGSVVVDVVMDDGVTPHPDWLGVWLQAGPTYWSWIRDGTQAGWLAFTGQVQFPNGQPLHMKERDLLNWFWRAPGTDDPRTIDDESQKQPIDLSTPIDLPDGRTETLETVMAWTWYRAEGAFQALAAEAPQEPPPLA